MGYENQRVNTTHIQDYDRCNLCGLLCSIDFFLETNCFHLFCVSCFENYLKRNGHNKNIKDEKNYVKLYHPVQCPGKFKLNFNVLYILNFSFFLINNFN